MLKIANFQEKNFENVATMLAMHRPQSLCQITANVAAHILISTKLFQVFFTKKKRRKTFGSDLRTFVFVTIYDLFSFWNMYHCGHHYKHSVQTTLLYLIPRQKTFLCAARTKRSIQVFLDKKLI